MDRHYLPDYNAIFNLVPISEWKVQCRFVLEMENGLGRGGSEKVCYCIFAKKTKVRP